MANPVGRPTLYDPRFNGIASKFAKLGLTIDEIADAMSIGRSTLYEWMQEYPDFADAINEGRGLADADVASSLYHRAMGYSHPAVKIMAVQGSIEKVPYIEHYPPDTVACIFWLKNRQPRYWRDKAEDNLGDVNEAAVELQRIASASRATAE